MSSQTIRLRLVIRRHSVPEVKLVWPCIANDDLTVSKLLALVNEVVPLESRDWGLEDYVVELADGKGDSFELLHFQPVGKVLKEDDQVLIRSLSTDDLRRRRLSGRHQISLDGKHLIDGLAFGRPWLRPPRDRPALDLPPRKRARITHEEELEEEEEEDDEETLSGQLMIESSSPLEEQEEPDSVRLRVRFLDTDQFEEEEEDEEEADGDTDFRPTTGGQAEPEIDDDEDSEVSDEDEPDVDLIDELKLLHKDNALIEQEPQVEQQVTSPEDKIQNAPAPPSAPKFDLSMLDKITALRAAFPFTSLSNMQDSLEQSDKDLKKTYQLLAATNSPTVSFDEVLEIALLGGILGSGEPDPQQPLEHHSSEEEEQELETQTLRLPGQPEVTDPKRPLIQEVDDEGFPSSAPDEPMKGISKPLISVVDESDETSSSSDSSDSDSDSVSDEESYKGAEENSDSDSDSSDSEDESMDDAHSTNHLNSLHSKADDTANPRDASSSDSSDSNSDSDSSSDSSKVVGGAKVSAARDSDDSSESDSSSDSDSSSSDSDSESEPEELSSKKKPQVKQSQVPAVPEAKTESSTPKSAPVPIEGSKPPGAGLTRTKKRNARRRDLKRVRAMQALEDTQSQPSANGAPGEDAEFLARKRALLSVVSDESEDVPKDTRATGLSPMIVEVEMEEAPALATTQDAAPTEESAPQRRHKVDMGAGRRMLFGALGLKNPKSKADEDKLRNSLMKDVKPLQNPRVQSEETKANTVEPTAEQENEDPEAWRKNISYRAVECCQENIVLSEPPFPFVQRWDPQQQYTSVRKRKRASQNFNDDSYYGEESQWNGEEEWQEEAQKKKRKKSKKRKGKGGYDGGDDEMEMTEDSYAEARVNGDDDVVLNYDDIPTTKPRLQDTQFAEMDDLPPLPSDITTLPTLELSEIKPGMVITWKQLLMSKATKWQPEIVSVTGLILSISEDNCLHVLLAKRDRDEDDKEYDEHTGQRVYAKFEVPDFDEDENNDEEDNGRRDIAWEEMSDPRLVQQAPPTDSSETIAKSTELSSEPTKPLQDETSNIKVSARTHPDETMAEELDTQKVRAEIEADLKEREAAGKPSGTDQSTSIPSGQQPQRLEFTTEDNSPISSFIRPMETPSDVTNSPTRQLRETMQFTTGEDIALSHDSEEGSNVEEKKRVNTADEMDGANDTKDIEEPILAVEAGWDAIVPDSMPSPDLPALPNKDEGFLRLPRVPSSAGSVRSGRQPPSISGLGELPEERVEDSIVENGKRTPSPQISNVSVRSSSPFPSLGEMFQTTRQTQSPAKFSQPPVPRYVKTEKHDVEYEEAMRKLDEGEDETDHSHLRNKSLRSLTSYAPREHSPLQRTIETELSQTKVVEIERITAPSSQEIKQESQFMVPEVSQVIELSSSSPSVQYAEHYAQDSEDETYHESSLPQGSSWTQKKYSEVKTRSRGKSLPTVATATDAKNKTTTTTQSRTTRGRTCLPPVRDVTASAYSQIRGRRKPTRKF
ncbi:srp40-suppressor of mutant ac40 of rna polymerase i and iii [Fusarium longipes]|uniref:Srp40-suppressor of mutant ac40 of rna polymerase i and iii n=1 Tax=Fusarium longipes TaxID=694270 RepID=A0A395T323_9HYPO|nr:srp40-suppressor of mutant ac40 of rna polymerase i and iii [Fusarium longipes]